MNTASCSLRKEQEVNENKVENVSCIDKSVKNPLFLWKSQTTNTFDNKHCVHAKLTPT